MLTRNQLTNIGSIITLAEAPSMCLGDLLFCERTDEDTDEVITMTFDPCHGHIEGLTKAEVDAHNAALSKAKLDGLDRFCQVGQGADAYLSEDRCSLTFWGGLLISDALTVNGKRLMFRRGDKVFEAKLPKPGGDLISFTRIA